MRVVSVQVKKEKIRDNILRTARGEFANHGFSGTTMRCIANKVRITTSNIYNYFSSKDVLFEEIVKPTTSEIMDVLNDLGEAEGVASGIKMQEYSTMKKGIDQAIRFIHSHRQDLDLILFKSHGSSIEGFKEDFIERLTNLLLKEKFQGSSERQDTQVSMSRFFLHNLCSFYTNIVVEIIMHDVPFKKMEKYAEEFSTFVFFGAKAVVG